MTDRYVHPADWLARLFAEHNGAIAEADLLAACRKDDRSRNVIDGSLRGMAMCATAGGQTVWTLRPPPRSAVALSDAPGSPFAVLPAIDSLITLSEAARRLGGSSALTHAMTIKGLRVVKREGRKRYVREAAVDAIAVRRRSTPSTADKTVATAISAERRDTALPHRHPAGVLPFADSPVRPSPADSDAVRSRRRYAKGRASDV